MTSPLVLQSRFNLGALDRNLADLDDQQGRAVAGPGLNSIDWVVGHITVYRDRAFRMLGLDAALSEAETAPFLKGAPDGAPVGDAMRLSALREHLKAGQARFEALLTGPRAAEVLGRPAPDEIKLPVPVETVGDVIGFLLMHETYHCGQVGTLRRTLGLPGAI